MNRVLNKVAIVTGSASGIGEATAKLLAREGAKVAVTDVDDLNGKRVADEIKAAGNSADFWHLDISREEEVEQVFAQIVQKYGQLNILVNNAGVTGKPSSSGKPQAGKGPRQTHEIPTEEWDYIMGVNLRGTFFCVKKAVPYMLHAGSGSVVNVASAMGLRAGTAQAYNTSKAAIRHMTHNDALIYAKQKIRFNAVLPGFIWTPLMERMSKTNFTTSVEQQLADLAKIIPMAKPGESEDIANGILYLASDEARYVTGSELVIDGGFSL